MIRAVVFDIGGVLEIVDDSTWPHQWAQRWRERGDAGLARERLAANGSTAGQGRSVTDAMSEAQVREMYAARFGLTERQGDAMMTDLWNAYCGRLDDQMRDFAASLRPRYTTAILSNSADGARREEQRRYDFAGLVDTIVYSHEVGVAKPDPAIYRIAAQRIRAEPAQIVFVDDSEQCVEGARQSGWHAVHHTDTSRTVQAVKRILESHAG